MWTLVGAVLSLLPERWRTKWFAGVPFNWPRAGVVSGILECFFCLLALIGWYLHAIQEFVNQQMDATIAATKGVPAEGAAFGMGAAALITFALHPLTWALAYFTIEGLLRCLAAALTDETVGTLPLVLIDRMITRGQRRAYERRVPLVADVVTRGDEKEAWDLKVESCRPKPSWRPMQTILYEEEYFMVAGEAADPGTASRPHVYLLRRPRPGEVYRSVEHFDPQAILHEAVKPPNFLLELWRGRHAQSDLRKLPLVADMVSRNDGIRGWHLQVESCRPKPLWTPPRTVRFEDVLYRVIAQYQSKPPRPFGYTLVCLPPHEAARGVVDYSPDEPLAKS